MENLKIKDLQLVKMIGRFDSLRALARHIDMEPQNLSKRFEVIESTLNCQLFIRSSKGISPTPEGEKVIEAVDLILQQMGSIGNLKQVETPYTKHLNLSSRGFIVSFLAPLLIREFKKEDMGLRFMDQSPEAMEKSARQNLLNVLIHFGEVDPGKLWDRTCVGHLPYVYVVKNSHPLGDQVSSRELKKYRMVGGCYIENNRFITPDLPKLGKQSFVRGFDSENSIYSKIVVKETFQFAYLPLISVIDEIRSGELRIITVNNKSLQKRPVFIDLHQDYVNQPTKMKLVKSIVKSFKGLDSLI